MFLLADGWRLNKKPTAEVGDGLKIFVG